MKNAINSKLNFTKQDIKSYCFYFLFTVFSIVNGNLLFADSPLTSTKFCEAYKGQDIVKLASRTEGKLTDELMNYLIDDEKPLEVKIALINQLGWNFENKNNSTIFFDFIKLNYGYRSTNDFIERANGQLLICMAYLKAMDNYFDVTEAYIFATNAKIKNKESYTVNIICALIGAQMSLDENDWCGVYILTNNVRINRGLNKDMKQESIDIIFNYMDDYKSYCN